MVVSQLRGFEFFFLQKQREIQMTHQNAVGVQPGLNCTYFTHLSLIPWRAQASLGA